MRKIMFLFMVYILFIIILFVIGMITGNNCMEEYVEKCYPKGSTYVITLYGVEHHIDCRGEQTETMYWTSDVEGCMIKDSVGSFIINTPYCFLVLFLKKIGI